MNCKAAIVGGLLCLAVASCSGSNDVQEKKVTPAVKSTTAPPSVAVESDPEVVTGVGGECLTLMEKYCISCHSEARVCQKVGKKSEARWRRTIKRMIKRGSTLPAAEQATLVDCLVNESDDIRAVCQ